MVHWSSAIAAWALPMDGPSPLKWFADAIADGSARRPGHTERAHVRDVVAVLR